jgi:hypothetical protein
MSRVGHRDPHDLQRALLAILPKDPAEALPMRRVLVRIEWFLDQTPNERATRKAAQSLAKAGAVGILQPSAHERYYRYWRRAA